MTQFDRDHPAVGLEYQGVETLMLRPLNTGDLDLLVPAILDSHGSLAQFLPWAIQKMSREDIEAQLSKAETKFAEASAFEFGLFCGGVFCAAAALEYSSPNPYCLDLSYWTPVSQQRKGYATLAARLAILYAFDCLESVRVQMSHDIKNTSSQYLADKLGFKREGVLRGLTFVGGPASAYQGAGDAVGYGMVPSDLEDLEWVRTLHDACTYIVGPDGTRLPRTQAVSDS